jgi:arylsulfatase A-like enzyme
MVIAALQAPVQPDKPNILIIFGDDTGQLNVPMFGGDIMGLAVSRQ